MDKKGKIITASAFGALIGSGAVAQSFAHAAASPSDAGPDPFDNPDFALQNAMDVFDGLRDAADPMTPQMLHDTLDSLHISEQAKSDILKIEKELFGDKYQSGDALSQEDLISFAAHAGAYLELSARGFTNISYSLKLEKEAEFKLTAGQICGPSDTPAPDDSDERLEYFKERISPVPAAREAFDMLDDKNIDISFTGMKKNTGGYYSNNFHYEWGKVKITDKSLYLNEQMPDEEHLQVFFHEIRHAQQGEKALTAPPDYISPADLAWQTRVLEADAQADAVVNLLKIAIAGDPSCFTMSGEDFSYNAVYYAALQMYKQDPASLDDGRLKRVAFDAWFETSHGQIKKHYDKAVIEDEWPRLQEAFERAHLSKTSLDKEFIERIGTVNGAEINYLTLPGFRSVDDPYYKENFSQGNQKTLDKLTDEKWLGKPPQKKPFWQFW